MQIFFATLPKREWPELSSSFLSEHCLSPCASEFARLPLFEVCRNGGRKGAESVQRACIHDFTTAVVTHPAEKVGTTTSHKTRARLAPMLRADQIRISSVPRAPLNAESVIGKRQPMKLHKDLTSDNAQEKPPKT